MNLRLVKVIETIVASSPHGILLECGIADRILIPSHWRVKHYISDYLDFAALHEVYILRGLLLPAQECVGLDPSSLQLRSHQD